MYSHPFYNTLHVHGQGLTSMEPNQYTGIMLIQASDYPICGTWFGVNYRKHQVILGGWILLGEDPQTMDMLPPIPYVLWVYVQGLISLWSNQYTGILFTQASEYESCGCGTRFGENCKNIIFRLV